MDLTEAAYSTLCCSLTGYTTTNKPLVCVLAFHKSQSNIIYICAILAILEGTACFMGPHPYSAEDFGLWQIFVVALWAKKIPLGIFFSSSKFLCSVVRGGGSRPF